MALPRRKPNRLPNYDYSQAGYYFITLCTKDKQPLFWQPSVGADIICPPQGIQLSSIGRVVDEAIRAIPAHYPNVALDKFVVMPNHIHLILALAEPDGRIISAPTKPLSGRAFHSGRNPFTTTSSAARRTTGASGATLMPIPGNGARTAIMYDLTGRPAACSPVRRRKDFPNTSGVSRAWNKRYGL